MLCTAAASAAAQPPPQEPQRTHVLFITADDLRPELSAYGHHYMNTPATASLAAEGYTFAHAYVQQALCNPSRTAVLTGRRPDSSRVWHQGLWFRDTTGREWRTLPQTFKKAGYRTIGLGKVFGSVEGNWDKGKSWSVHHFHREGHGLLYGKQHHRSHGASSAPLEEFEDGAQVRRRRRPRRLVDSYENPSLSSSSSS